MKAPTEDELKAIEAVLKFRRDELPGANTIEVLLTEVRRLQSVTDLLVELSEYFDDKADIVDGDWPDLPRPNQEMSFKHRIDVFLGTAVEGF